MTYGIQFTPEQEAKLSQIASMKGIPPARLVQDAALHFIEDDERFRTAVRNGIDQADRGIFIDENEMESRVARMLNAGCAFAGLRSPQTT